MNDLLDLAGAVKQIYAGRGRPSPCKSNRASQLGYAVPELEGCLRRGVYCRTNWQDAEPWPAEALMRFEEGNRQERHVLQDLAAAGITVIEQQSAFEWEEYNITGHVDGCLLLENGAVAPLEIKSCSENIFTQISDWESLNKKPWLRAYKCQITIYSLMKNSEWSVLLFKNKSSGALKQINVPLDYELGEACIKAAENINAHIDAGTLPERITDKTVCANCRFKLICLPDIQFGEPLKIVDDEIFEQRLNRYDELAESANDAKRIYQIIRDEAKAQAADNETGELNLVVGKWRLTGKPDAKGAFRLKIERI